MEQINSQQGGLFGFWPHHEDEDEKTIHALFCFKCGSINNVQLTTLDNDEFRLIYLEDKDGVMCYQPDAVGMHHYFEENRFEPAINEYIQSQAYERMINLGYLIKEQQRSSSIADKNREVNSVEKLELTSPIADQTSGVGYEGWSEKSTLSAGTAEKTTKGGVTISMGLASVPLMWMADSLGIVDVNSENIAGGVLVYFLFRSIILWWLYSIYIYIEDFHTVRSYSEYVELNWNIAVGVCILGFVVATMKWLFEASP